MSKGSISLEVVRAYSKSAWMRLKMRVGGEVFGRYIGFGRGSGCARYKGRSCVGERGREV